MEQMLGTELLLTGALRLELAKHGLVCYDSARQTTLDDALRHGQPVTGRQHGDEPF